jgi:hypothetical protein
MASDSFEILIEIRQPDEELIRPLEGANAQFGGSIAITPRLPRGMLGIEALPDLMNMAHQFADPVIGVAFLKHAKDVIVTWLKGRNGRKLKLKAGGRTVEITGPAAIDDAIAFIEGQGEGVATDSSQRKRRRTIPKKAPAKSRIPKKAKKSAAKRPVKKKTAPAKAIKPQRRSKSAKSRRSAR